MPNDFHSSLKGINNKYMQNHKTHGIISIMNAPHIPQIKLYTDWLHENKGLEFVNYDGLWRWSTTDLSAYWKSIWDYFDLESPTPYSKVCDNAPMPHTRWFKGATFNYVAQVFRHIEPAHAVGLPAIISHNEKSLGQRPAQEISWPAVRQQVASLALHLRAAGVDPGDRVVAYLPNIPEAIIAFLAVASIGGVWSICAPDMGTKAVLDRFQQIEPKALIACDAVSYGGRDIDRREVLEELCKGLPTVRHVLMHNSGIFPERLLALDAKLLDLKMATAQDNNETKSFTPILLPFEHPLWIVYSSGTTGPPKPIVHGHGGTVIVALALKCLHNDIGCSYKTNSWGERYHWYSSTGWVMWNAQVSGLLNGTTCCIFDGSPAGPTVDAHGQKLAADWGVLWKFAAEAQVTFFGAGAAFYASCQKAGVSPMAAGDLRKIRALGTTGSPLSPEVQKWGTEQFQEIRGTDAPEIWWCNISGGTDFAGAFIGGNRELPQVPGEMQCRLLGCAVEAWNEEGESVTGEVGELVCVAPLPSMPLYFWGDEGDKRYLSSYFDMYPGVWRHGDWLKVGPTGACVIYGRSDATINRHGLRMGTSELYSSVEALSEVVDSMVVDLEYLGKESYMPLFVVLKEGLFLDEALKNKLNQAIKTALSPRFIPNEIFQVPGIPRTLSGKKQELPIKKLLLGQPLIKVINPEAMANPECLTWFADFAVERQGEPKKTGQYKSTSI